MNRHIENQYIWQRTVTVIIVLLMTSTMWGCRHFKSSLSQGRAPEISEASAVYTLACTGMATARNMDEFNAALSAMDARTGLDFSGENPVHMIKALHHGLALMEQAEKKAGKKEEKSRLEQKQLKQNIQRLEKQVATLKHQIAVLENIDQERREKRTTE